MLSIEILRPYNSIKPPFKFLLNKFTVLTGFNGSGKSHFLKAISENLAIVEYDGIRLSKFKYYSTASLSPNDATAESSDNIQSEVAQLYSALKSVLNGNSEVTIENLSNFLSHSNYVRIIREVIQNSGISLYELDENIIYQYYPVNLIENQEFFHQQFSKIFKRYNDKLEENHFNEYLTNVKGINKPYFSEENFIKLNGPKPWELLQELLDIANLDYFLQIPENYKRGGSYRLRLIHKINKSKVDFNQLSSGEKILMSLALALYNINNTKLASNDEKFTDLLLLDEPDAPLHPSMTKELLRVIKDIFVDKLGIAVIMTTHSPSTVAMTPEENLFVMRKQEEPRIVHIKKQQILNTLTKGIPTLGVNSEKRRQVFVESDNDAMCFNEIYRIIKEKIDSEYSLNFVSSGPVKNNTGNCDQVRLIVNLLRSHGNTAIYGVIDWDLENSTDREGKIFVPGDGSRYNIENFLLDPTALGLLLLIGNIKKKNFFGIDDEIKIRDIYKDKAMLQSIVDNILRDLTNIESKIQLKDFVEVSYYGGMSVYLPKSFLEINGHQMADRLVEVYPELKRFNKIGGVILQIVCIIYEEYPELIPTEIFGLIQMLSNDEN
ncbi:hypothetical protein GCM10028803_32960 [Larkinella knui]|uniref:ATP-binding protein n=1 Tax=Larkinella knui TaxID=2025310 RepID=A0A3P1CYI1_9BACT|nr:ATP-binding protein [Larkinella knui]RRB18309.1 ATP-binding protein [Larkinella knui]